MTSLQSPAVFKSSIEVPPGWERVCVQPEVTLEEPPMRTRIERYEVTVLVLSFDAGSGRTYRSTG